MEVKYLRYLQLQITSRLKSISRLLIFIGCIGFQCFGNTAVASYPTDPTADIEWPHSSENTVNDIQTRFNSARTNENALLGISIPMISLPSQGEWNLMSDSEKALWLINRERIDRGVDPLHALESNVMAVAQEYAQYLMDNNEFSHDADGNSPWDRLNSNPAIGDCHDFLNIAENLAVLWGGWTLPIERSIYMWMYDDSGSNWGHRHAILWYPYNDNSGLSGMEGFLGIGRASGTHNGWSNSDIIVMNVFDPCSGWQYGTDASDPLNVDDDGDGYTENEGDCDDTEATIYPSAIEICGDGIDQDCNGSDLPCDEYIDTDGDLMDDNWEINNFGDSTSRDGFGDLDRDGYSDYWEYANGTSPLDGTTEPGGIGYDETTDARVSPVGSWTLDIDGNGEVRALTDGILLIRYLLGFSAGGNEWIDGALASGATRASADLIEEYIETGMDSLDIDGNGEVRALTDGILLIRYLLGFSAGGDEWIDGALASGATRISAEEIENYINMLMP